jgi:hypothetical protein
MESAPIPLLLTKNTQENLLTQTCVVTQVKLGTVQMAASTLPVRMHHGALLREQLIFAILKALTHQESVPIPLPL